MKRRGWAICILTALMFVPLWIAAQAEELILRNYIENRSAEIPVYATPLESAYRGEDGKATIALDETFRPLATTYDRTWMMIEYDMDETAHHIGWIRMKEDEDPVSISNSAWVLGSWDEIHEKYNREYQGPAEFESLSVLSMTRLAEIRNTTILTDDPGGKQQVLRRMQEGEKVGAFVEFHSDYTFREWAYIITEVDGKKACGFVPAADLELHPGFYLEGDTLVVEEGVEVIGETWDWMDGSGIEYRDDGPLLNAVTFGMIQGSLWDFSVDSSQIHHVRFPSTLKLMGDVSLLQFDIDTLVIPEGVERMCGRSVLREMRIGTLSLPSTLWDFEACTNYCGIVAYDVSEESPFFEVIDGVLFSRDGKKLVAYPNESPAEHYDVPRGTEEIGPYAFDSYGFYYGSYAPVRLKSLSLPNGLRRIGESAFLGLEELVNLVIPLTVTELDPFAFGTMAGLEQLSMPVHLWKNKFYQRWQAKDHQNGFSGDNGDLIQSDSEEDMW